MKKVIIAIICVCFVVDLCTICSLKATIKEQEAQIAELQTKVGTGEVELNPCLLCGGQAKLNPINDSFYIECLGCELQTDYYDSKAELIEYWNKNE